MTKSNERPLPGKPSKEADRKQLRLARNQGDEFKKSIQAMRKESGRGKSTKVDDYIISYSEENAEGLYRWHSDQLIWENPEEENIHMEIVVEDAKDGRFIPYLEVHMAVFESGKDNLLYEFDLPFLWHPWLYHYGANIRLKTGSGSYDLLVSVSQLKVSRHDKINGDRYAHPVEVRFDNVPLTAGKKLN